MHFFSNLRVTDILSRKKGHMGFFIISEVVLEKLKNLKNSCLQKGGLKTEQNPFFLLIWGSITQQQVIFISTFLKSVILLQQI